MRLWQNWIDLVRVLRKLKPSDVFSFKSLWTDIAQLGVTPLAIVIHFKLKNSVIKKDTSKDSFIMSAEVNMNNQTKQKRSNYTIEFKQDAVRLVNEK